MSTTHYTPRVGKRYRANRLNDPYDAIVIGSGIGGLTSAICLGEAGKKVLVLEQHYTAGGFTHSYEREGYEWDVGVHYIGDVGAKHTMASRLFDFISGGKLTWQAMDDCYDRILVGDQRVDLIAGPKHFVAELKAQFPNDGAAIDTYMRYLSIVGTAMPWLSLAKIAPRRLAPWLRRWAQRKAPDVLTRTTREVLESITQNQSLIAALTGQWGDNGLPPSQSSFIIHAIIARHYLHGGYYPVGGASAIARHAVERIEALGGTVFNYADVKKILVEQGRACGVLMSDGTRIEAPIVISNAGVFNTYTQLLPADLPGQAQRIQQLGHVQRSMASVCVYIGLKATAEQLQLPKTNLWIYPSNDYEAALQRFLAEPEHNDIPLTYISFPSAKDPDFATRYPGRATIEIVAPGPHDWYAAWQEQPWGKRGDDYEAKKRAYAERLLEKLYEQLPHLRGQIDYYELSTPLSTQFFCRYAEGEIYGLDHDPRRFEQDWLRPKTDIPGLYLTGQDVLTCGVVGAMVGGLLTAVACGGPKTWRQAKRIMMG